MYSDDGYWFTLGTNFNSCSPCAYQHLAPKRQYLSCRKLSHKVVLYRRGFFQEELLAACKRLNSRIEWRRSLKKICWGSFSPWHWFLKWPVPIGGKLPLGNDRRSWKSSSFPIGCLGTGRPFRLGVDVIAEPGWTGWRSKLWCILEVSSLLWRLKRNDKKDHKKGATGGSGRKECRSRKIKNHKEEL